MRRTAMVYMMVVLLAATMVVVVAGDGEAVRGRVSLASRRHAGPVLPPHEASAQLPVLPSQFFRLRWERALPTDRGGLRPAGVQFHLPIRWLSMVDGDELAVLGPTTGREAMRFRIPETARQLDETGSLPSYTLLRTPDGMLAVAVQPRYGVSAVEGSASAKAYVQRILELHAFRPSGEMVWSARIPGFRGRGAFEVAAGKERLLLVGGLSGFALYDAGGTLLGIRDLDYSSGLIVSDTDGDGTTEFYLIGPSSAACYELGASGEAHGAGS